MSIKPADIFNGSSGLNIKVDPVRHQKGGLVPLSESLNVTVDMTGRVGRVKGFTELSAGNYHSLCPFDCGGYGLIMKGSALFTIDGNGGETGIRSGMTDNARVSYAKIYDGLNVNTYYANGYENGRVAGQVSYVWSPIGDYSGPPTTREFAAPPNGHLLEVFNGRMYVADENIVYFSQHGDVSRYNLESNQMIFDGRVTMMKGVDDGMYVSAGDELVFLSGQDPMFSDLWQPFSRVHIADFPVVEGCYDRIDGARVTNSEVKGKGFLCYGPEGICFAGNGGLFVNLTADKLTHKHPATGENFLPGGEYGAGIVFNDDSFLITIEP